MDRLNTTGNERPRRAPRGYAQLIPVVWILILLAAWFLIGQWHTLPDLISAAMAAVH